jgi:hypothetical protein
VPTDRARDACGLSLCRPGQATRGGQSAGEAEHTDRCGDRYRESPQPPTRGGGVQHDDFGVRRVASCRGELGDGAIHRREVRGRNLRGRGNPQVVAQRTQLFAALI